MSRRSGSLIPSFHLPPNPIRPPRKAPGPLALATPLPTALAAPGGMAGDHASVGNGERFPMSRELIEVPLNKLVVAESNVRRTGAKDGVEELAASILAHGLLQPLLVVACEDGRYAVIAGSRRLAAMKLLAKRKALPRGFAVPVMVREAGEEESLAENVVRMTLHPADQYEAFRRLELSGLGAADIAARFGVSLRIVRQRLALGAVAPHLMQAYRDGELTLAQLEAFTVTDDPVRQDQVYQALGSFREPWRIRAALTQADISGRDRRVQFLGLDVYEMAGGAVLRDLFSTTDEVWLTDAALLDRLCLGKLGEIADQVAQEGWLWTDVALEFPHSHGCRRVYPFAVELTDDVVQQRLAANVALEELYTQHPRDEVSEEVAAEMARLDEEITRLSHQAYAYDPAIIPCAGVFVVLGHDGDARIERGFVRPQDEVPEPEGEHEAKAAQASNNDSVSADVTMPVEAESGGIGLSDRLIADLSAQRTVALRDVLARQPDIAMLALAHTLILQGFYGRRYDAPSCLTIRIEAPALAQHAEGIDDGPAARAITERHEEWAKMMPQEAAELWDWLSTLDRDSRDALLAHVVAQSVNALILPHECRTSVIRDANRLAQATGLAMRDYWSPTVPAYLGRVTKAAIMQAVEEGVSNEAAQRLGSLTKVEMARQAERLLVETDWLPAGLRTPADVAEGEQEAVAFAQAAE
ncbi:ParB/RepB/Spo0J family partition protein [Bosea caraganae]|uniref:ParB/RepB/Spo0J family partition protein n=2 Tax=Bosea caraganae TaxID=2763117 RepID=A0A370KZ30_9HYPH|nr:ParB/RepB/Spo0J family partition protein [Bosea caraganae]RDJ23958.1 ParB/RepB/Spo0J family partition protein [Bosea caraganae]